MIANKIDLKFSLSLMLLITVIHIGAIICILFLSGPWQFKLMVGIPIISWIWQMYSRILLWWDKAIISLVLTGAGEWKLLRKNGIISSVKLLNNSVISSSFMLLNFSVPGGFLTRSIWLLPSSTCDQQVFRRLRVYLRWNQK